MMNIQIGVNILLRFWNESTELVNVEESTKKIVSKNEKKSSCKITSNEKNLRDGKQFTLQLRVV